MQCNKLRTTYIQILFQEKDVKDSRYFYKRAYFVAVLADALRKSDLPVEVDIIYQGRNRRKPIIELRATGGRSKRSRTDLQDISLISDCG